MDETNHRLFVSEAYNERVLVYNLDADNELIDTTANFVIGQPDFTSNATATTQNGFNLDDGGLVFDDANNRLFVSDESNCRVMVFDTTTITNGMNASNVIGQPDFTTGTCSIAASTLEDPESTLSYDAARQYLFVPQYVSSRVLVFDVNTITNGEAAIFVIGQDDFTSSTNDTTATRMKLEYVGSAFDPATNYLYISDSNNNRVLVFDTTTITNGMAASYVLGQTNFTNDTSGLSVNQLDAPEALAIDAVNKILYVADSDNYRILMFDVSSITNGEDAVSVIGQADFDSAVAATPSQFTSDNGEGTGMYFFQTTQKLYVPEQYNNRVLVYGDMHETEEESPETDDDGSDKSTEDAAPNSGDANNDGTLDSEQSTVTGLVNSATASYSVVAATTCTANNSVSSDLKTTDPPRTTTITTTQPDFLTSL